MSEILKSDDDDNDDDERLTAAEAAAVAAATTVAKEAASNLLTDVEVGRVTRTTVRRLHDETSAAAISMRVNGAAGGGGAGGAKKRKQLLKTAALLNATLDATLENIRVDRLALEKARRFVVFCKQRIEDYKERNVPTVYAYIGGALAIIKNVEQREEVADLVFQRLERLCCGINQDGEAVQRPLAIKDLDSFLEKNGLVVTSVDANERYGRELPLVDLFTLLLGTCKCNDKITAILSKIMNCMTMLPKLNRELERSTVQTVRVDKAQVAAADLSKMNEYERTAFLIENDAVDSVALARDKKLKAAAATAADDVESTTDVNKKRKRSEDDISC